MADELDDLPIPGIEAADEGAGAAAAATDDDAEAAQEALVDQIAENAGVKTDGEEGGEGGEDQGGETTQTAPQLPEWSKPLQATQQKVANIEKSIEAMTSGFEKLLQRLEANPTAANQQKADEVRQQQEALQELERQIADPNFDATTQAPGVLQRMLGLLKQGESRYAKLESELTQTRQQQTATSAQQDAWNQWAAQNPDVGRKRGEELWDGAVTDALQADPTLKGAALQGAAKVLWMQKLAQERAAKAQGGGKPPEKKPLPPKTGGQLGPAQGRVAGTRPKPKALDDHVRAGRFNLSGELL